MLSQYELFSLYPPLAYPLSPPPRRRVGFREALSHTDLWVQLWDSWLLLGDSVSVQRVLSHAGMEGNERADQQAVKGAKASLHQVTAHKAVADIWAELGLEEMPDEYSD